MRKTPLAGMTDRGLSGSSKKKTMKTPKPNSGDIRTAVQSAILRRKERQFKAWMKCNPYEPTGEALKYHQEAYQAMSFLRTYNPEIPQDMADYWS